VKNVPYLQLTAGRVNRYCGAGQCDKDPAPEKLKWSRHSHHVAKEEKMRNHKAKHKSLPPDKHREYDRARDATEKDESIDDREAKARNKGCSFHAIHPIYGRPRDHKIPKPATDVRIA
jgi:hypothetical protein